MSHILVVDDEPDLCEILRFNFEAEGFVVTTCLSAEEVLALLPTLPEPPDLMLLDVMMQNLSGFDLARLLRQQGCQVPIIFLTARSAEQDQLSGFEVGADDFIAKPFSFQTVLARVKAVLRRCAPAPVSVPAPTVAPDKEEEILQFEGLTLNFSKRQVLIDGTPIELTQKEFGILHLLLSHRDSYFSREDILRLVWEENVYISLRTVDVHITRLRKKLGSMGVHIINRTNLGYSFR